MLAPLLLFAGLAAPLLAAAAILWHGPMAILRRIVGGRTFVDTAVRVHASLARAVGRYPAAVAILTVGVGAVFCVCISVGLAAKAVQQPFDVPIFEWSQAQFSADSALGRAMTLLTQMGDGRPMTVIVAVAALIFAVLWRKREWWAPGLVLGIALETEFVLQRQLASIVSRGHPPTALGSFPSGGTARVIIIFGLIVLLWCLTRPELSQRQRRIAWVSVALLAAVESFTRLYLLQHWASDVVGGWIFGSLMLCVLAVCTLTLVRGEERTKSGAAHEEAQNLEKAARSPV